MAKVLRGRQTALRVRMLGLRRLCRRGGLGLGPERVSASGGRGGGGGAGGGRVCRGRSPRLCAATQVGAVQVRHRERVVVPAIAETLGET